MDAHIAFVTLPHSPHVFPTLPIVSSFIRRGYRVTYVTSDRFVSPVQSTGAEIVPCPPLFSGSLSEVAQHKTDPENDTFVVFAKAMLDSISSFYYSNRPSLILYDFMAFAGRILAGRLEVPTIQTSPFYALDESNLVDQVDHDAFRDALIRDGRAAAVLLRQHGIDSRNYRTDKAGLNIYLFPRALQPNSTLFGDDCFFAGRCPAERQPSGSWQDHSDGRPIALVAMSTMHTAFTTTASTPNHFKMCIDALAGAGWHVVLAIGEGINTSALLPLPAHCEMVLHTAYLRVLSRASLLFFNSGIISTAEAAYHGVPMVAISNGVEEFEWQADHIDRLGIGTHLRRPDTNVENLRSVALRLSADAEILRRVKEVQYRVRREPGAEETANCIEDYLHARHVI